MSDEALDRLRDSWTRSPGSLAFVPLAEALRRRGDLDEAIQVSRTGLDHRPNHSSGHLVLGRCLFDKGDLSEAIREFEEVVSLDSKNALALRLLGLALKGKGWGRAVEVAEAPLPAGRGSDGRTALGTGEELGDIEFFTRTMAEIFERQGFLRKALEVYQRLAATHPERTDLQERIQAIESSLEKLEREGGVRG